MVISFDKIHQIAAALETYRNGRIILFDNRDKGNYSDYLWQRQSAMLQKADPTGLALGMILFEMIDATIRLSNVELRKVLREPGFLEKLLTIQALERDLLADIGEPRARLIERLATSLAAVDPELGTPGSREVAISLRDVIYALDGDGANQFKFSWIKCDADVDAPEHLAMSPEIHQFDTLASFIEVLRARMPFGAHLVRIGKGHTAIGLKSPGRVAYLSSLYVEHGCLKESLCEAGGATLMDHLDIDVPSSRYPRWSDIKAGQHAVATDADQRASYLCGIDQLPRDRLIWLAMMVELGAQRMAAVQPEHVTLIETLERALPQPASGTNLPAIIEPNWRAAELSILDTLEASGLSAWEKDFLRPGLDGLSADMFFRVSDEFKYGIERETRRIVPWVEGMFSKSPATSVEMLAIKPGLAGTRKEIEAERQKIFARNLMTWLLDWGNKKFTALHAQHHEWFKQKLDSNMAAALSAGCVHWSGLGDFIRIMINPDAHFSTPNPRRVHSGSSPHCYLQKKSKATSIALFMPMNSDDLIQILGLQGEDELPQFLRGWSRDASWASKDMTCRDGPCMSRWIYSPRLATKDKETKMFTATVHVCDAFGPGKGM